MLHVITFATDTERLEYLKDSSKISNLNIHYIMKTEWNGYFDKIKYTKEIIQTFDDNDIICFIDAYDVLSLCSESEILNKFKEYNCDLLIGSELNCFPESYKNLYPNINSSTNYKYINSGGYIGYKHAIWNLMTFKSDSEIYRICQNCGDQTYFKEYYLSNISDKIKLDTSQKIFQNMHWVSWNDFVIVNGRIINTILDEKPCFIHFNGGTWQTNNKQNIIPIVIEKLIKSLEFKDTEFNLNEYQQIITNTCWPHKQK